MDDKINNNFRKAVIEVFSVQSGATGEIVIFDSFSKDLKALAKYHLPAQEWFRLINETLENLINGNPNLIKLDYLSLEHLPKTPHKIFVTSPTNAVVDAQTVLRAIRGAICIKHIKDKRRVTIELATVFKQMMEGKYPEICKHITFDQANVMEIQQRFTKPGTEIFKLLSNFIEALKEGFEHEGLFNTTSIVIKSTKSENKNDSENNTETTSSGNSHQAHPIHQSGDLLAYLANELKYATPRDFSGVSTYFTGLQPFELCDYMRHVLVEFRQNKSEILLGLLLTFHLRVGAAHFNLVGFKYASGQNVWIDLDKGHLCWNRLAIVNGLDSIEIPTERDKFSIPLPSELVVELRIKHASLKGNKLGEIFATPLAQLKEEMRSYAENFTDSSHKPYQTRLAKSVGRFYFDFCRDDVYAAAISMDFSVSTQSAFYYFVSQPKRVNQICLEAYEKIGYQPIIFSDVKQACGPVLGKSKDKLQQLLVAKLNESLEAFHAIHAKSDLNSLMKAHNKIAVGTMILTSSILGMRRAYEYSICSHTIDLEKGFVVITDKASSEYLTTRLLPIPEQLKIWLEFYFSWLTRLSNRLSILAPNLSIQIATTLESEQRKLATAPTFFLIKNGNLEALGSRHIETFFKEFDLKVNAGRHVIDLELRNISNSAIVNIYMGHANPGQEGLGLRSALPANQALAELKVSLDQIMDQFYLPKPPDISKARVDPIKNTKLYEAFRPKLWKVRHG